MEKKEVLNKLKYVLIFALSTISLEIVAFWSLNFGFLPSYFLFDLAYILINSAIIFLMKGRKSKIAYIIVLLSVQFILNIVNASYYAVFSDVFSLDLLKIAGEATKVFKPSFINYKALIVNALIFALFIMLLVSLTKTDSLNYKAQTQSKRRYSFCLIFAIFLTFISCGLTSNLISYSILADTETTNAFYVLESDAYLYKNFQFKQKAYKKFGTFGFYIKSLEDVLIKDTTLTKEEKQELQTFLNDGVIESNNSSLLKDKNLIVLMLESFDWFAIDPICTPTLYDLAYNSGYTFTNFRAYNKTNMSEDISLLGNFPKKTDFQNLARSEDFAPKSSLAYLFKDNGYTANYFHSYDINFYSRNVVNKKFGFDSLYGIQDSKLGNDTDFGNAYLEQDFLNTCLEQFAPKDKRFFSFYTTFGTHGPYSKYNERYEEYYGYYEEHLPEIINYLTSQGYKFPTDKTYYNYLKNFKCASMDTDKMVANLIKYLNDNNLMDNTAIVLFADHNCYYDETNLMVRYGSKNHNILDTSLYNIPFIIYDKTLGSGSNNTFCSTYDIYPTICNLFGLEYNKNFTQGNNIFSEDIKNSIFVSNLSGIFNDKIYSSDILDASSLQNLSKEEIYAFQLNALKFYEKQEKIDKIYLNKLYNRS